MNDLAHAQQIKPLKLKRLLQARNITQAELGRWIRYRSGQYRGRTVSPGSISHIVNRGYFGQAMDEADIKAQIEENLLALEEIEPEDLKHIWDEDDGAVPSHEARNGVKPPAAKTKQSTTTTPDFEINLPEQEMLSEKAMRHFGLRRHPFLNDVSGPEDVYLSEEQRYIRETMSSTARHGGFVAVVGESGSGKSTLRRDLLDRIRRDGDQVIAIQPQAIDKTRLTAAHICDAIIHDLGSERPKQSLEAKARQVQQILSESARAGNSHVLIIEEAHDLAVPTLKYLKRFWELEDGFKKLVGIILIGQPELGERLDEQRNWQMREVIRRCEVATLRPLNGNLEEYLGKKFKRIGADLGRVFQPDAFDAIRNRLTFTSRVDQSTQSHVYPLVVHHLAVKAMNLAAELGEDKVSAELVEGV